MEVKLSDKKVKELQNRFDLFIKESFEGLKFQLNKDIDDIDWSDIKNLTQDIEEFQIKRDFLNIIFDECKYDNQMEKVINNNITCNILELCSELAHKKLLEHYRFFNSEKTEDEIEDMIYEKRESCITNYIDEAQDIFNDFYDEFYTIIEKLAL